MVSIHTNHRLLLVLPASLYLVLVALCAVWPAVLMAQNEAKVESVGETRCSGSQRHSQSPMVDQGTPRRVHQNAAGLHPAQLAGAEERLLSSRRRSMQRNDIRLREKPLEGNDGDLRR